MRILFVTLLASLLPMTASAAETVFPLWPEGVPHLRTDLAPEHRDAGGWTTHITEPTLTVYPAAIDRRTGTAIVICPGGGYSGLSFDREGEQYARWFSSLGITSFILKNRVGEYGHPAPLQDALRALRLVRSRAAEFGVNPERIGIIGSSAGGHLAACAATLFDHAEGKTGAALDAVSARPDFLILMYPVILMEGPSIHAGSRQALIGPNPSPELVQLVSVERQVTAATPPALLIHTQDDKAVPVENSIAFYQALTRAGVPAELHLFEHGGHGMGMRPNLGTASEWPRRAEEWLRVHGLLSPAK